MKVTYTETTYKNNTRKTTERELTTIKDTDRENELINIYPQMKYQKLEGFGGAVTKLTMQNEPKAVQTWDSCVYTAEEEKEFLRD